MSLPKVTLLLLTIAKPTVVALYDENNRFLKSYAFEEKITDGLYKTVKEIERSFEIVRVAYANGPGSFMGLKLGYVFLQTYSAVRDIPFVATESFTFADKIHSNGKRWFVKSVDSVDLIVLDDSPIDMPNLPERLDLMLFSDSVEPNYILPAV